VGNAPVVDPMDQRDQPLKTGLGEFALFHFVQRPPLDR